MPTDQQAYNQIYSLLTPREQWKQILIFPAVDTSDNGVLLSRSVSNYMLWIELPSGKVWGLTLWTFTPFISFHVLERIAQRLETVHPKELETIITYLAKFSGWHKAEHSELAHINLIAEDLARAEIRATLENSMSVKLAEENVRKSAQPHKAAFVEGLLKFNDALDMEVTTLLGNEPILSFEDAVAYNHLIHPVPKLECYRRQAVQTFPLLRGAFTKATTDYRYQRLQQNVDSGNPLLPVLADFFRCQLPVVRFLVGKDFAQIGEEWLEQVDPLVDLLDLLKPDYWPKTQEEWQHVCRWILPVFSALGNFREREYPEMMASCLDDLVKEGYERIPARLERHGVTLIDITTVRDFENAMREWSAEVGIAQSKASAALWQYSVLKVAVLSHRWHDWLARRMEDEETKVDETDVASSGWPTFISTSWHHNRHTVVPLNHPWILQEEGRRMKHCVGTYVSQCRYFGSHIFSIRDSVSGKSLSTVELRLSEGSGSQYAIVEEQHRAYDNAIPTADCEQTLKKFLRYLAVTVSREQFIEILKQQQQRRSESDEFRRLCYRPAWPRRMKEEFRELLHGYPLLENLGYHADAETAEDNHLLSAAEVRALLNMDILTEDIEQLSAAEIRELREMDFLSIDIEQHAEADGL